MAAAASNVTSVNLVFMFKLLFAVAPNSRFQSSDPAWMPPSL
jgi:hypothetical protein